MQGLSGLIVPPHSARPQRAGELSAGSRLMVQRLGLVQNEVDLHGPDYSQTVFGRARGGMVLSAKPHGNVSAGAVVKDRKHDDLLWESMRYKTSWITRN